MSVEVVSFALGGLLIATAIIGGGFEIRELRMPVVSAPVRGVSLVVGAGFIVLGLGVWGADRPHLLDPQASAAIAMPLAPPVEADPLPPPAVQHVATPAPPPAAPPPFSGVRGRARLYWEIYGVSYEGSAEFHGASGFIRVAFVDPSSGLLKHVDQDLALVDVTGTPVYQGMNPRYPGSSTPDADYSPDAFRLVPADGAWSIDMICDDQGLCAPVTTVAQP